MNSIAVAIRKKLINDPTLKAIQGERVYPTHINSVTNPVYPCSTQGREGGGTTANLIATDVEQKIDVWSKVGYDELWLIYNQIRKLLHLQPLAVTDGQVFSIKETYVNDNLYEPTTKTWHLASRYKIISR